METKKDTGSLSTDYVTVTETAGDDVSAEQVKRLFDRYHWAVSYCHGKDVVEVACGTGQGLGYLASVAKSVVAGDISQPLVNQTKSHYGDRIDVRVFDAQKLPFEDKSKDVILLFEAVYYIPSAEKFAQECTRVLRPGGVVLLATANKDLFDFNPSPYSHTYYGVKELGILFGEYGFTVTCFGNTPLGTLSLKQRILRPIKKLAVDFNLIPKTTAGKKFLKRFVFGKLVAMPLEINAETGVAEKPTPLPLAQSDKEHKVIFCAAHLRPSN